LEQSDILLITPPFIQLNTAYPATVFLKGFLQENGFKSAQADLSIETILALFSKKGLSKVFDSVKESKKVLSQRAKRLLNISNEYVACIDPVITFLQGKDLAFAQAICRNCLPQGERFNNLPDLYDLFGDQGITDKAKFLATLFIEDIGDFIEECVDPHFGFSRYAFHVTHTIHSFAELEKELAKESILDGMLMELLNIHIAKNNPRTIGLTVPFPGNFFAALKIGKFIKTNYPNITVIMGGGYVNTELRSLSEPNVFKYVDFVCLDDGERPLLQMLGFLLKGESKENLKRTFFRENNSVVFQNSKLPDFEHEQIGTPDYEGIITDQYISVLEVANSMHRLWSDGRWNKLAIAHGCYWHRCSFCDTTLDYIKRYSPASAVTLCNRIESIIGQTKQYGFHFIDEAAPSTVLKNVAIELLRRNITITWWANIRFDKTFTADLCQLMAQSGCIGVSGGLEVASDRLLEKMQKGISIEQVVQVTSSFQNAGIMVHAYLMYGFPTETDQETIDSLEIVRQLFKNKLINSGFWHIFVMTEHSPVGQNPELYGVQKSTETNTYFTQNGCIHNDLKGCEHEKYSEGLRKSLYNYMHQKCIDFKLQEWFDFKICNTTHAPNYIENILKSVVVEHKPNGRLLWSGKVQGITNGKKGFSRLELNINQEYFYLDMPENEAKWLADLLTNCSVRNSAIVSIMDAAKGYTEATGMDFDMFVTSRHWNVLRKKGLIVLYYN
jgi:radical SAM superfamily enzyme YgiQ (UPF0313 family)